MAKLPKIWFCIKYTDQEKVKWFRSKKGRNDHAIMNYFRNQNNFQWGKVYKAFSTDLLFWFNRNDSGTTDRRTTNKLTIKK